MSSCVVLAFMLVVTVETVHSAPPAISATGVIDGVSVLRCSLSPTSRKVQQITWKKFLSPINPQIVYFDKVDPSLSTKRDKGKYGPFKNRDVTGRFHNNYHELVISGSTSTDNSTSYMCTIKETGSTQNEDSRDVLLSLLIPPNRPSEILEIKGSSLVPGGCGVSQALIVNANAGDQKEFICQSGGQRPTAKVHWTHNGTGHIDDVSVRGYTDERYKLPVQEASRRVVLNVSNSSISVKCTVQEVDLQTGSTRNVSKCLLVRVRKSGSPSESLHLNCLYVVLLFTVGPAVIFLLELGLKLCGKNSPFIIEQAVPQTCTAIVVRTFGHILFGGALAAMICLCKTPQIVIGIVLVLAISMHLFLKLFTLLKMGCIFPMDYTCLRLHSSVQGVRYCVWVIIGCGEVRYLKKTNEDDETAKPLQDEESKAATLDRNVRTKCRVIFVADLIVSLVYIAGILWILIDGKCYQYVTAIPIIFLIVVVYLGCIVYPLVLFFCFAAVSQSGSTKEDSKEMSGKPADHLERQKKMFDVVLFYTEKHFEDAKKVKQLIVKRVKPKNGGPPRVILWKDDPDEGNVTGRQLDLAEKALERSTFVFILITKDCSTDPLAQLFKEEVIAVAIDKAKQRNTIIPLYTLPKGECEIPFGLKSVNGINVRNMSQTDYDKVASVLNSKPRASSDHTDGPGATQQSQPSIDNTDGPGTTGHVALEKERPSVEVEDRDVANKTSVDT